MSATHINKYGIFVLPIFPVVAQSDDIATPVGATLQLL